MNSAKISKHLLDPDKYEVPARSLRPGRYYKKLTQSVSTILRISTLTNLFLVFFFHSRQHFFREWENNG